VQRLHVEGAERPEEVAEALQELRVPGEGLRLVVPLGVAQEQVADLGDRQGGRRGDERRVGRHEAVERLPGGLLLLAAADGVSERVEELDLLPLPGRAGLNVPAAVEGAEERLLRHGKPSSSAPRW
jgi:hypothetical protein